LVVADIVHDERACQSSSYLLFVAPIIEVHRRIADGHPAVRSLGAIACLIVIVSREDWVVAVDKHAFRYQQKYRCIDNNTPMTADPAAGTIAASAGNADTAPPLSTITTCRRWFQTSNAIFARAS
jgi:hypothetical protein